MEAGALALELCTACWHWAGNMLSYCAWMLERQASLNCWSSHGKAVCPRARACAAADDHAVGLACCGTHMTWRQIWPTSFQSFGTRVLCCGQLHLSDVDLQLTHDLTKRCLLHDGCAAAGTWPACSLQQSCRSCRLWWGTKAVLPTKVRVFASTAAAGTCKYPGLCAL